MGNMGCLILRGPSSFVAQDIARSPGDFYDADVVEEKIVLDQTPSAFQQLIAEQKL